VGRGCWAGRDLGQGRGARQADLAGPVAGGGLREGARPRGGWGGRLGQMVGWAGGEGKRGGRSGGLVEGLSPRGIRMLFPFIFQGDREGKEYSNFYLEKGIEGFSTIC
jgi:hypothetical protein